MNNQRCSCGAREKNKCIRESGTGYCCKQDKEKDK